MFVLILFYFVSHFVSFICSILESVLLCSTKGYLALLKKRNKKAAEILIDLKGRIDRPLAAILTLNTAAHTVGAAGVGVKASELFGEESLWIVSLFLTLTMLIFTEMIPKTVGALYWKTLAPYAAAPIRGLMWFTYPFVVSFEWFSRLLLRKNEQDRITGEEIRFVLKEGTQAGVIKEIEHDMLESIFRLGTRRVNILMIPRMEIEWIDLHMSAQQLKEKLKSSPHSRFPVCDRDLNTVIGFVSSKDILDQLLSSGTVDLSSLITPPLFIPENMRVVQLLELFRKTPDHLALVTDEYGGIEGLVTLHDVLESIVGDVPSSPRINQEEQLVQRKDGSWLADGMLPIDEFKEAFHIDSLPDEGKGYYRTLAGFCMKQMGRIAAVGDEFEWNHLRFKIIKMDERRIERVLIRSEILGE